MSQAKRSNRLDRSVEGAYDHVLGPANAPITLVEYGSYACPTLAGVILALFIPTRPPPNLSALMTQANTIVAPEARQSGEVLRHGPSVPALRALDAIHDTRGAPVEACRVAVELRGAAAVRVGQCRCCHDDGTP